MTIHAAARAALPRLVRALGTAVIASVGLAGPALAGHTPLYPGPNEIVGKLSVLERKTFSCPVGTDILGFKTAHLPAHSDSIAVFVQAMNSNPLQLGLELHNGSLSRSNWCHITFRCDGQLPTTSPWPYSPYKVRL